MTTTADISSATKPRQASIRRVAAASFVGTSFEFYDHYIYGAAAAIVLPKLFFPESTPWTALLLSFATYGVAFASRPLGAAIFGHFGDRVGRKNVLVATLLIMGLATFGIGLLPTHAQWGSAATTVLVALRFIQGLALGGEWGGAALMVNEYDPEGRRRGFLGGVVQAASPVGLLFANGVFSLVTWTVSPVAFFSWGWRVPFLASAILVAVGLYIRIGLSETPVFAELDRTETEPRAPIMQVLTEYPKELVLSVGSRVGSDIAWYVFAMFMLVYLPKELGLPASIGFTAIVIASAVQLFGVPFFGAMSDRFGRRPVLLFGAIGGMIWGFVFFWLLDTKSPTLIVLGSVIGMNFHAALWAPLASFIPEMFPTRVRWTGASLGFQLAGLFGGALAPIIATSLVATYSSGYPVALYLAAGLMVIVISVLAARETSEVNLRDVDAQRRT